MDLGNYINTVRSQKPHPIIFVSGFRGSGKTTLAKKLVAQYPNTIHFDSDWYFKYSSKERASRVKSALESCDLHLIDLEENPINQFDWDTFERDIKKLQNTGKLLVENAWDQKSGERNRRHVLNFSGKNGLIICDGHRIIHPEIIRLSDFSIMLDVEKDQAAQRANARDEHRSSKKHLAGKKILLEKYDVTYFDANRKNVSLILSE